MIHNIQVLLNIVIYNRNTSATQLTLRDLQNPGIAEYGDFKTETLPLLKVTLRDLQYLDYCRSRSVTLSSGNVSVSNSQYSAIPGLL